MGKSLWRNEPVLRLARCWASLSALRTVGMATGMPAVPGVEAMQQPLVLRVVVLIVLVAAFFTQLEERGAVAAEKHTAPVGGALQVLITTSELVVGQNRFAFGLLQHNKLLDAATVAVRVYDIRDQQAQLTAETPALYHKLEVVEQGNRVHVHPDGTRHVHSEATDVQGIYVAHVTFVRPGPWGLEILAQQGDGPVETARLRVNVLEVSHTPTLGAPAPRSRNLIASDVGDLRQIDSSEPPDPRLHQTRIADAIAQGKPQVIVFATPKFCTSRVCGPVVDVVRMLLPAYGKRVVFIHQEIWQSSSPQKFSPTVEEWNLRSEPWIFVVDGQGMLRAKFEGLTTRHELEAAVKHMLGLE
jgi:hypothetical protein